jgi:hypothetical protein
MFQFFKFLKESLVENALCALVTISADVLLKMLLVKTSSNFRDLSQAVIGYTFLVMSLIRNSGFNLA